MYKPEVNTLRGLKSFIFIFWATDTCFHIEMQNGLAIIWKKNYHNYFVVHLAYKSLHFDIIYFSAYQPMPFMNLSV